MKRFWMMMIAMGLASVMSGRVVAEENVAKAEKKEKPAAAEKAAKPENPFGKYAGLVKSADLTEEQQAKLKQIVSDEKRARDEFEVEKGKKIADLEAQLKPLQEERRKIDQEIAAKIAALLSPDQVSAQNEPRLVGEIMGSFRYTKTLELTQEQKDKIAALCKSASAKIAATSDKREADEIKAKLRDEAMSVLTPAQRAELELAKPAPKPAVQEKPKKEAR
jgi:Spy/CpxP family protein refolding chaperone